ncbi:MAG: hypothetical protein IPM97_12160 [Bdellovibrionaceae bacterium]|nr:hypothetical protein [Pseudobdellovibrionaceae bacterium]
MNKFSCSIFLIVLIATPAFAEISPRELAIRENSSIDQKAYKKTIQASEAQQANVQSFLKLQDPAPELRRRAWLWTFALKLQSFKPLGTGRVSNATFSLEDYGPSLMPSLEFGFLSKPLLKQSFSWFTGLATHVGYMTQKTQLVTPSGYSFDNAHLNSGLLSLIWSNRFNIVQSPSWSVLANPEFGVVNYTQTATKSTLANFTQQSTFWGLGLGVEYALSKKWGLVGLYSYRQRDSVRSSATDLQKSNFEIGTSVIW